MGTYLWGTMGAKIGKMDGCCVPPLIIPLTIKRRRGLLSNLMGQTWPNDEESLAPIVRIPPVCRDRFYQSLTSKPNCFKVCWKSSMDSSSLFTCAGIPGWFSRHFQEDWHSKSSDSVGALTSVAAMPGLSLTLFISCQGRRKPSNLGGWQLSLKRPETTNHFWEISLWNPLKDSHANIVALKPRTWREIAWMSWLWNHYSCRLSTPEIRSYSAESSGASPQNPAKDSSAQNIVLFVPSSSHAKIKRVQIEDGKHRNVCSLSRTSRSSRSSRTSIFHPDLQNLESPGGPEDFDALFPVSPPLRLTHGDTCWHRHQKAIQILLLQGCGHILVHALTPLSCLNPQLPCWLKGETLADPPPERAPFCPRKAMVSSFAQILLWELCGSGLWTCSEGTITILYYGNLSNWFPRLLKVDRKYVTSASVTWDWLQWFQTLPLLWCVSPKRQSTDNISCEETDEVRNGKSMGTNGTRIPNSRIEFRIDKKR